ncbi:MAG: oxygenase MpaB family protein [Sphingomonadaceae bacterium]
MASLRDRIAAEVRRPFADPSGRPSVTAAPPDARLLPEGAVAFEVNADVTTMMIGGIASLMVQMLHPAALAGVWDFSSFRTDMGGRLRRTAAFIATTTYGDRAAALAAIERVNRIHAAVRGRLPGGTPYHANDPRLLAFVGVTEALGFLGAWVRYREPAMPLRRQDAYVADMAAIARRLGADPMPTTRRAAEAFLIDIRPELRADQRTREVARLLLSAPAPRPALAPAQRLMVAAAIDLMPGWARRMHGIAQPPLPGPLLRGATSGLGALTRWALSAPRPPQPA